LLSRFHRRHFSLSPTQPAQSKDVMLSSVKNRTFVVNEVAQMIGRLSGPVRVAIDGRTASGKTTFADELAVAIGKFHRETIRSSIDGFHRPKVERYARGRYSAEGYYFDARDLAAIRSLLLDPLAADGNRLYRTASFDLEADRPIEQTPIRAAANCVLIVDGTFLLRPELADGWDAAIFLNTSESVSETRGIMRDAQRLGGIEVARQLYSSRYRAAFNLYDRLCHPFAAADIVIDNNDFDHLEMRVRPDGRLTPPK
jgi:uridine kinase